MTQKEIDTELLIQLIRDTKNKMFSEFEDQYIKDKKVRLRKAFQTVYMLNPNAILNQYALIAQKKSELTTKERSIIIQIVQKAVEKTKIKRR